MTVKEAYEEWFLKPVLEYVKKEPEELINYLQNNTVINIYERYFGYDAVHKRLEDPTYLNVPVEIDENRMLLNDITPEIKEVIVKYISKDVTELTLPNKFLEDITFLANFPKLKKLKIIGYCKFKEEEIAFIKEKTSIKEIDSQDGPIIDYNYKPKEGEIFLSKPSPVFISGDLINRAITKSTMQTSVEALVGDSELDLSLLEKAYMHAIKPTDSTITSVEIKSANVKESSSRCKNLLNIKISGDHEIEKLIFDGREDASSLADVVKKIETILPIKQIHLHCSNQNYENIHYLNPIAKKYDLVVDYGDMTDCSLEDFLAMRETINYFNELIRGYNLSPLEKLTFAYDIMKTFAYKENEQEKEIPRTLHSIVSTDYIVCLGYSKFLTQLLKENGITATEVGVTCNPKTEQQAGHSKTLVRIDDDKYNIHGVYCVDATWDRSREKAMLVENSDGNNYVQYGLNEGDTVMKEFDPLGLYRNFLVPAEDYPVAYPDELSPSLFRATKDKHISQLTGEKDSSDAYPMAKEQLKVLFKPEEDLDTIYDYMLVSKPPLEVIKNVLYNVRIAQGYTREDALRSVDDNIELNQMIDEFNREIPTFFKPSQKK